MLNEQEQKTALNALKYYGAKAQSAKAIEELAELQQAIAKWLTSTYTELITEEKRKEICDNIIEEIADCYIMLYQMTLCFENRSTKSVDKFIEQKIIRLHRRIEEEKEENDA